MVASCGSFESDVEMICDVEARTNKEVGSLDKVDESQLATILVSYIEEHVKTDEGRAVLTALKAAKSDPDATSKVIREAAKKAGVNNCAAVATFRKAAEHSLARKELQAICAPRGKLRDELRILAKPTDRIAAMDVYLSKNLESAQAKALYAKLRDNKLEPAARVAAAKKAGHSSCAYADDIQLIATTAHKEGLLLVNAADEDLRDLAGGQKRLQQACKLGLDKACRQLAIVNALLAAKPK